MEIFGYLDPGTGSVIAQALIGIAVGAGVLVKTYWTKIKNFFGGKSNNSKVSKDLRDDQTKDNG